MISDTNNRCNGNFQGRWITEVVIEDLRKEMGLDICLKNSVDGFKGCS